MNSGRILTWAAASVAAIAGAARAAPIDPAAVSGRAKFVVHVDLERARQTAVGARLLEAISANPDYIKFEELMIEAAGFMPAADIADVTLYGEAHGRDPKTVMVVHAKMDAARLRSAIEFADAFRAERYGTHELLSWVDVGKGTRTNATLFDGRTLVMSADPATLRRGLDVLDDREQSLAAVAATPVAMPLSRDAGVWAFAGAVELSTTPDAPGNPVLSQLSTGLLEVGEIDGKQALARAALVTLKPEQGPRLLMLANGAKAMAELSSPPRADAATAQPGAATRPADTIASLMPELLAATSIVGNGGTVTLSTSLDNDRARDAIAAAVEAQAAR